MSDISILRPLSALDQLRDQLVTNYYEEDSDELLIKLNPDGTFRQCTEGFEEGRWISGRWRVRADDNKLLFALDRQYYGPAKDVLLEGTYSSDLQTIVHGQVYVGKFMYPKQHPSFFDEPIPLSMKNETGTFSLEQAISAKSITPQAQETVEPLYPLSTFYNRSFYLIVSPIEIHQKQQLENQPFDLRTLRIQFHTNHTFQAFGHNKILRGRYGVRMESGGQEESLWFQVSLFGAGRSAPGSVYSEGIGLQKDDAQLFVGTIATSTKENTLIVQGSAMIGSDLGSDARPEPVGSFQMMEITQENDKEGL